MGEFCSFPPITLKPKPSSVFGNSTTLNNEHDDDDWWRWQDNDDADDRDDDSWSPNPGEMPPPDDDEDLKIAWHRDNENIVWNIGWSSNINPWTILGWSLNINLGWAWPSLAANAATVAFAVADALHVNHYWLIIFITMSHDCYDVDIIPKHIHVSCPTMGPVTSYAM